jgi:hypothetical protein
LIIAADTAEGSVAKLMKTMAELDDLIEANGGRAIVKPEA